MGSRKKRRAFWTSSVVTTDWLDDGFKEAFKRARELVAVVDHERYPPGEATMASAKELTGFEKASMTGIAWTQVSVNKYPHNRKTLCCDNKARAGQMVVAIPAFQNGTLMGTAIVHGRCLKAFLEGVPDDIDVVEEAVEQIVRDLSRD